MIVRTIMCLVISGIKLTSYTFLIYANLHSWKNQYIIFSFYTFSHRSSSKSNLLILCDCSIVHPWLFVGSPN